MPGKGNRRGEGGERRKGGRKRERGFLDRGWGEGEEKEGEGRGNKEYRKKEKSRRKRNGKEYKIGFWNVAGMENKEEDFREKLKNWDVMLLSETWLQKKSWERVRRWPKGYVWEVQEAGRKSKKGRAIGGMIMGIREGLRRGKESRERMDEGIQTVKVELGGEWWRLVGVYVNGDLDEKMRQLREWMEEREEGVRGLIGGDFNARTGRKDRRGGRRRDKGRKKEIEGRKGEYRGKEIV